MALVTGRSEGRERGFGEVEGARDRRQTGYAGGRGGSPTHLARTNRFATIAGDSMVVVTMRRGSRLRSGRSGRGSGGDVGFWKSAGDEGDPIDRRSRRVRNSSDT